MIQKEFMDKQLGKIVIRENSRAKRIILRATSEGVLITIPRYTSQKEAIGALEKFREKLLATRKSFIRPVIDFGFMLNSGIFSLSVEKGGADRFFTRSTPGKVVLVAPPDTRFNDDAVQDWLRKVIEQLLKKSALELLYPRIKELAARHGFSFRSLRVNTSKGRWGSCSSGKSINLSCYLVLLPVHLIDYVILHELCHTLEMNHGDQFWKLLNGCTADKAWELRAELKNYHTGI